MYSIDQLFDFSLWPWLWKIAFFSGITFLLLKGFRNFGTKAKADDAFSRWSSAIKPAVGGFVFYVAFLFAIFPLLQFTDFELDYVLIFLAGSVAFGLGLWDDMKRISPGKKFGGQILAGLLFASSGHSVSFFADPNSANLFLEVLDAAIVVFIVVAVMNSVNMLDNMDGVSSIAVIPALLLPSFGSCIDASAGMVMLCGVIGFLILNWTPAKVFMGDSGSMLLGFMVSWMILGMNHCHENDLSDFENLSIVVLFLGAGALFVADTMVVVIQRLRHKISPFTGGRDHTTHNLFYLGLSQGQIAVLFILLGLVQTGLVYGFLDKIAHGENVLDASLTILLYFFLLFGFHLTVSFRNLRKGKYGYSHE
jgi:UDP-GlcNAc:undecaprenyl-phosphate GlcNAc-1-phosphate transferase